MRARPDPVPAALDAASLRLQPALWRCACGELPPNVALSQLFLATGDANEARSALVHAAQALRPHDPAAAERLHHAIDLWERTPDAFEIVNEVARLVDHETRHRDDEQGVEHLARAFDHAAALSSAASVALYSLGRPDLLDAASNEVVERMRAWSLLRPDYTTLEIGCGNGRILQRLAREVRLAVGIDISARMLEVARRLGDGIANAVYVRSSGTDLALFPDSRFDLVYAIDAFPYLVQCKLAAHHLREAARVLTPGGGLLIVNYSYRNDLDADRAEIMRAAGGLGLTIERDGTQDFALWDGRVFLLRNGGDGSR